MRCARRPLVSRVEADRVARWIKQDPHVLLGLVPGQLRSEMDCAGDFCIELGDLEVEMQHHLLTAFFAGPNWPDVVGVALDAQVGHGLTRVERGVILALAPDDPAARLWVEARQLRDVRGVQDVSRQQGPTTTFLPLLPLVRRTDFLREQEAMGLRARSYVGQRHPGTSSKRCRWCSR